MARVSSFISQNSNLNSMTLTLNMGLFPWHHTDFKHGNMTLDWSRNAFLIIMMMTKSRAITSNFYTQVKLQKIYLGMKHTRMYLGSGCHLRVGEEYISLLLLLLTNFSC